MAENRRLVWIGALLGGLLAGVALPPLGCPPLLWIALLPQWGFGPGPAALWAGTAVLLSHRWLLWLHPLDWVGVPLPLSLPLCVLLWLLLGLLGAGLVALWRALVGRLGPGRWSVALLASALWGLGEVWMAKGPLFWLGLGSVVLPGDRALAGLAQWVGAGGLAALQLLLAWGLWRLLLAWWDGRRGLWRGGLTWLLAVALLHGLGWQLLQRSSLPDPEAPWLSALVLQPDIPTREKFSWTQQRALERRLREAQAEAEAQGADLLVLPEGALALGQGLPAPGAVEVLSGGFRQEEIELRSSVLLFPPQAQEAEGAIDKHRLVPLGEWVPGGALWRWAGLSAVGGVEPGPASRLLQRPQGDVAVAICYEIADGAGLIGASRAGAGWILASANLDPYPLLLQQQFQALSQLRAIEASRWLVSSANTGPSLVVRPDGALGQALPPMHAGMLLVRFQVRSNQTPYGRWGEWPLLLTVGAGLAASRSRVRQS
ncbi:apolipoprotein N-acyltransferase [Synechococcus sp. A10-1-5-1]|uniref:apolipoprotein N-acyltransferase n=1 Tax=Synechococcus sp. A10-1-5-1 TaxID=2936507 RepID=UPI002001838B|nr:apolipoprotein N-acyltransferase [Synechococcus sp. A10-1-5-1]UPM49899.1 apolipoprotein N-acyltransferase [Synechococcus sp. A10-1-5-1]